MRMDPSRGVSASEWIASADEDEIAQVFKDYGEERFAKRMARAVVQRRAEAPFERTADLAKVLTDANPAWEKGKNPATRAFQGLRIHINNELGDLECGLDAALEALEVSGRPVVISFHSLEDRIVKQFMRRHAKGEADKLPRDLPIIPKAFEPRLKLIGKPQYASEAEVKANPRSRSLNHACRGESAMSRVLRAMPNGSLLMLVLFVSVLLSAIAVAYCAHWNRQLLNELYGELSVRDKAQAEWGRLILEQSTRTAHSRIETLATEQLRVLIPAAADVRLVKP